MLRRLALGVMLVAGLLLYGCAVVHTKGPVSAPSLEVQDRLKEIRGVKVKKVAILPLADYSYQQNFINSLTWGANRKIREELSDNFLRYGIKVCIQEDVDRLLQELGVLRPVNLDVEADKLNPAGIEAHLEDPFLSAQTKRTLVQIVSRQATQVQNVNTEPALQGVTTGLSKVTVRQIGEELGAGIIIRGRILECGIKRIDSLNPLHRGVWLAIVDSLNNLILGVVRSDRYEEDLTTDFWGDQITGGTIASLVGRRSYRDKFARGTRWLDGRDIDVRGLYGRAIAGAVTSVARKRTRGNSLETSILQVRLYAQDASTGELLWTNRMEVEYSPLNPLSYNVKHYKVMFDKVIDLMCRTLVDDLFEAQGKGKLEEQNLTVPNKGVLYQAPGKS